MGVLLLLLLLALHCRRCLHCYSAPQWLLLLLLLVLLIPILLVLVHISFQSAAHFTSHINKFPCISTLEASRSLDVLRILLQCSPFIHAPATRTDLGKVFCSKVPNKATARTYFPQTNFFPYVTFSVKCSELSKKKWKNEKIKKKNWLF